MKLVNTKAWAIQPTTRESFRIGRTAWVCRFKLGRFALIQLIGHL